MIIRSEFNKKKIEASKKQDEIKNCVQKKKQKTLKWTKNECN